MFKTNEFIMKAIGGGNMAHEILSLKLCELEDRLKQEIKALSDENA